MTRSVKETGCQSKAYSSQTTSDPCRRAPLPHNGDQELLAPRKANLAGVAAVYGGNQTGSLCALRVLLALNTSHSPRACRDVGQRQCQMNKEEKRPVLFQQDGRPTDCNNCVRALLNVYSMLGGRISVVHSHDTHSTPDCSHRGHVKEIVHRENNRHADHLRVSRDNQIKQRQAWLLLGWVTAMRSLQGARLYGHLWWFGNHL
ncbi:hypothetical protein J6590_049249 [Homalodisca vitripennis]|nr:hypothetical protein J6590_049249 [Homalodisca vitripennis]